MMVIDTLLLVAAAVLLVPCLVLLFECGVALLPWPRPRDGAGVGDRPRVAVLIPAHDEEGGIGGTVRGLLPQLAAGDRVVVIADNCSDGTAGAARAAGAQVIERVNADQRGKGFAIVFGLDHLDADPPDVVVLVDADCRLSAAGIERLARQAAESGRPVQGEYLLGAPENPTPLGVVSALAVLVRNRVRPLGLRRLGLPCQLTGSGMAFPWPVLRNAPHTGANLVEDLVMGIELAIAGHPPLLCPDVQVSSELPDRDAAAMGQRRRWEHGQLATLTRYGPRLVGEALRRGRVDLLAMGMDLMVPPLALLINMLVLAAVVTVVAGLLGASWLPALLVAGALAAVGVAVLGSWIKFARKLVPLRFIVTIPLYIAWKIPLYLSLLVKGKQKTWERTRRKGEDDPP